MALTEKSKINLTVAAFASLMICVATAGWKANELKNAVNERADKLQRSVDRIEQAQLRAWQIDDQVEFTYAARNDNPSLKLPDPKKIVRERISNFPAGANRETAFKPPQE